MLMYLLSKQNKTCIVKTSKMPSCGGPLISLKTDIFKKCSMFSVTLRLLPKKCVSMTKIMVFDHIEPICLFKKKPIKNNDILFLSL